MLLMVQESSDHPHGKDLQIPAINGASMPFYYFVVCFSSLGHSPSKNVLWSFLSRWWFHIHMIIIWIYISNMVYFHPHLGKIPILTDIFELGWNHQLVMVFPWESKPLPGSNGLKVPIPSEKNMILVHPIPLWKHTWILRNWLCSSAIILLMEEILDQLRCKKPCK